MAVAGFEGNLKCRIQSVSDYAEAHWSLTLLNYVFIILNKLLKFYFFLMKNYSKIKLMTVNNAVILSKFAFFTLVCIADHNKM